MTTAEFLSGLRERDVRLWIEDGQLKCDAPPGALDERLREQLVARKHELLTFINEAETTLSGPRSLVPLKPTGDLPPLFARPGHNGDVFCYRPLAAHLDVRRPLYGVEPKGLDGSPTLETIEEMAAYEVAQIREFQPEGPYYLAGYCAGGAVAFESARQLAEAGGDVARVVLFGSPFPTVYRAGRMRLYLRSVIHRVKRHTTALARRSVADGLEYVRIRASARMTNAGQRSDQALANRRRVEDATIAAVKRYEPAFYSGRVDVFLPNEAWRHSGDRSDGWKQVAGLVVEHVGPDECDGDDMLQDPHVRVLAALLTSALSEGEGPHAAD